MSHSQVVLFVTWALWGFGSGVGTWIELGFASGFWEKCYRFGPCLSRYSAPVAEAVPLDLMLNALGQLPWVEARATRGGDIMVRERLGLLGSWLDVAPVGFTRSLLSLDASDGQPALRMEVRPHLSWLLFLLTFVWWAVVTFAAVPVATSFALGAMGFATVFVCLWLLQIRAMRRRGRRIWETVLVALERPGAIGVGDGLQEPAADHMRLGAEGEGKDGEPTTSAGSALPGGVPFGPVPEDERDYRVVLRRVGWIALAVGVADIAFMVWRVARGQSYSSSLNIFAAVAGVLLLRGSLRAAGVVEFLAAFVLGGFLGAVLVFLPIAVPLDLLLAYFRVSPMATLVWGALFPAALIGWLYWVYRRLRMPSVLAARQAAGLSTSPPRLGFYAGVALVAILSVAFRLTTHGGAARRAAEIAREQLGPDYRYCVTSISWSGDAGRAMVTAYTRDEIREVEVEW